MIEKLSSGAVDSTILLTTPDLDTLNDGDKEKLEFLLATAEKDAQDLSFINTYNTCKYYLLYRRYTS